MNGRRLGCGGRLGFTLEAEAEVARSGGEAVWGCLL